MDRKLLVRDFLGFDLTQVAEQGDRILDELKTGGPGLKVRVVATSSGKLINSRVYPGKFMPETVKLWTDKAHGGTADFCKPVLLHHQSGSSFMAGSDPIGRIRHGEYIQAWKGRRWELDYKRPDDENGSGSGHQILTAVLTDREAIQKVLDERYLCVSQSGAVDSLKCSICQMDWWSEGFCEHRPGRVYKKEDDGGTEHQYLCYLVTGPLDYHELSFVNVPADGKSKVISFEATEDALDRDWSEIFVDDSVIRSEAVLKVVHDSLESLDLGFGTEESMKKTKDEGSKVLIEMPGLKPGELDSDQTSTDVSDPETPASIEEPAGDPAPQPEDSHEEPEVSEPVMTDQEFALAQVARSLKDAGIFLDADSKELGARTFDGAVASHDSGDQSHHHLLSLQVLEDGTVVGRTYATIGDGVEDHQHVVEGPFYNEEVKAAAGKTRSAIPPEGKSSAGEDHVHDFSLSPAGDIPAVEDLEALIAKLEDAEEEEDKKLSSEQRKNLKPSQFCGANKSFPVPDCAHVIAARRLVGRAKLSPDAKAKVLACVSRKAKALGCESKKKDQAEPAAPPPAPAPAEPAKQDEQDLDTLSRLLVGKTEECSRLSVELDQAKTILGEKDEQIRTLSDTLATELKKHTRDLAVAVVVVRSVRNGTADQLKVEGKLDELATELSDRSPDSLSDTLRDLLAETPDVAREKARRILAEGKKTSDTLGSEDPYIRISGRKSPRGQGAKSLGEDLNHA